MSVSCVLYRQRSVQRADHLSRLVVPIVCLSLSVNKYNNNPLHLQGVSRRGETKKSYL
jgi:hypothetical protein